MVALSLFYAASSPAPLPRCRLQHAIAWHSVGRGSRGLVPVHSGAPAMPLRRQAGCSCCATLRFSALSRMSVAGRSRSRGGDSEPVAR